MLRVAAVVLLVLSGTALADNLPPDAAEILGAHNARRADHCAPPLDWSPKLAQVAQRWADHLKKADCGFDHSGGEYGENLAAATTGSMSPTGVVDMWYAEVAKFDFKRGGFSMDTGHFTQVVWRGTKHVGCGSTVCNGMQVWVCNYDPSGNFDGEYRENVLPKTCSK